VESNNASAYKQFADTYPTSSYTELAMDNFYDAQFAELTTDGTLASYIQFIQLNPSSPLVPEAEKRIYAIATKPNTLASYQVYIDTYPESSQVPQAWLDLYEVYLGEGYSLDRMIAFKESYLTFPHLDRLKRDIKMADSVLLPIAVNERFGYVNINGQESIPF